MDYSKLILRINSWTLNMTLKSDFVARVIQYASVNY